MTTQLPSRSLPPRLSIGEVCRLTGLRPGTLRSWEERYQLLTPARTPGGTRLYSRQDVKRIRQIQGMLRCNGNSLLAVARSMKPRGKRERGAVADPTIANLERLFELAGRAIAARIVELQGGSIALDSTPGHGRRFTIRLPLADREATA